MSVIKAVQDFLAGYTQMELQPTPRCLPTDRTNTQRVTP
jgi:hypothetical protein